MASRRGRLTIRTSIGSVRPSWRTTATRLRRFKGTDPERRREQPRYEGWRVAAAASVGVFVSFASLLVYTFGIFLKPLAEEFSRSRESVSLHLVWAR